MSQTSPVKYQPGLMRSYSTPLQSKTTAENAVKYLKNINLHLFRIVFSFEVIAENVVGQDNFTNATFISQNVAISGTRVHTFYNRFCVYFNQLTLYQYRLYVGMA